MPILNVCNLCKTYQAGEAEVKALDNVSFTVEKGEFVSIIGPSGSGKSTLLNTLGCLDTPTSGEYYLDGIAVRSMDKNARATLRNRKIGFVFQNYNLLAKTTALENVELPLMYNSTYSAAQRRERAEQALRNVGLGDRMLHKSNQMSGGQMQRVAIASVLVMNPDILVLDEPTAGLDPRQRVAVRNLIGEIAGEKIVLLCTHVVQDVEFIARELILMNQGLAIRRGSPHALEQELEGQVWELTAAEAQLPGMAQYGTVCGVSRQQEGILVRLLSEARPPLPCAPARPDLEDVYLFHFGEGAAL